MTIDAQLIDGARRALERHGWQGATLQRLADEAGVSRMTLHRHGVSREVLLAALADQLEREYREALWPALTAPGSARGPREPRTSGVRDGHVPPVPQHNGQLARHAGELPYRARS